MATINLRDFYKELYTRDCFVEVPEEVVKEFADFRNYVNKRNKRKSYHSIKFYSLDCDDGIESKAKALPRSAEKIYEGEHEVRLLHAAIDSLPEKQSRRLHAHFFLDKTISEIAKDEKVSRQKVRESIDKAIKNIKKFMQERGAE